MAQTMAKKSLRNQRQTVAQIFVHYAAGIALFNLLSYNYIYVIVPFWGYLGYVADPSMARYIIATLLVITIKYMTPKRITDFISFVLVIFSSVSLIPMLSIYAMRGYSELYLTSIVLFFWLIGWVGRNIRVKIPNRRSSVTLVITLCLVGLLLPLAWMISQGALTNLNFSLIEMYDFRPDAMRRYFIGPFIYLNNWASKLFLVVIFAVGLIRRSPLLLLISVSSAIFFYGALSQKTPIALLAFTLFSVWAVPRQIPSALLDIFLNLALILVLYFFFVLGEPMLSSVIANRTFFGPALNNVLYFEFFRENPYTFFSNSFLEGIVDYPYNMHVLDMISIERSGDVGVNPNTGALGTGFMHLGYMGLLFYAVVVGLIISVISSLSKNHARWVPVAVTGPGTFIMLTSTDVSVALLTNGLLVGMIIIFLWPTVVASRPEA